MGVDIGDLFKKEKITVKDLNNRVIAIDAHNVLHQFLASIRQRDGTPLKNSKGQITSHLSGILYRTANLVDARIRPVYVFDGEPHPLKVKTIQQRRKRKEKAEKEWKEALEKGDLEKAKTKAQQTSRVTTEIIKESKDLLNSLGIPYIQAPSEGEAQASHMVKKGKAYATASQDFDCLLVGCPIVVVNLTLSSRRKLPGKKAYSRIYPEQIRLKPNLRSLGITHKQLVDMAILIGTDFNDGIRGIGPKKSLNLIKKTGNAENAIATSGGENLPTFEEIKEIRKIFLEPKVTDNYSMRWSLPNNESVLKILCDQHQFRQDRVEPVLEKFSNIENMMKQKTLF
ncbi:MAG: flap endonuclease-1 [Thermoplasmatales archaeon]|nr:MAG: flap endonuclease-1 [Thermoplasmatales archaeon]